MVISFRTASANHSTDPIAQSVRGFIAPSGRLESRTQAAPATPGELDLARLYPSVFGAAAPAVTVRSRRATGAFASVAAAALALIVGVLHHS